MVKFMFGKRFHTSNWRSLETCCRPRTWWCNDATALVGYVKLMMMMIVVFHSCSNSVTQTRADIELRLSAVKLEAIELSCCECLLAIV